MSGVAAVEEPFCLIRVALGVPLSWAVALGYPPPEKCSLLSSPPPRCGPEHHEWASIPLWPARGCLVPSGRVGWGAACLPGSEQGVSFPSCQQPIPNVLLTQGPQQDGLLAHPDLSTAIPWGQLPAQDTIWALIRWKKNPESLAPHPSGLNL